MARTLIEAEVQKSTPTSKQTVTPVREREEQRGSTKRVVLIAAPLAFVVAGSVAYAVTRQVRSSERRQSKRKR